MSPLPKFQRLNYWKVLRMQVEEMTSRHEEQLWSNPPVWGMDSGLTTPHHKKN
jgi:hypothetical protein